MLFIHDGLNFTAMSVARTLEDVESGVQYEMALLVHIPNWPVTKLTVVNDAGMSLLSITEGKSTASEFRGTNTLHFALSDSANSQGISHN